MLLIDFKKGGYQFNPCVCNKMLRNIQIRFERLYGYVFDIKTGVGRKKSLMIKNF